MPKNTLMGKIILNNSGENNAKTMKIISEDIFPTWACPKKILNRENKTNPKSTREIQQMFTIISLRM